MRSDRESTGCERDKFLYDIHHNIWDERVYEAPYRYVYKHVLDPTEREVVRMKVNGLVDGEIALKLEIKLSTIKRKLNFIRQKYRLEDNPRVDNEKEIRYKMDKYVVRPKKRKIK